MLALEAHLRSVPRAEWDAASLVEGQARRWLRVRLPLTAPGLATGAVAVAFLAASEASATVLLAPPGSEPVIVRINDLMQFCLNGLVVAVGWNAWFGLASSLVDPVAFAPPHWIDRPLPPGVLVIAPGWR